MQMNGYTVGLIATLTAAAASYLTYMRDKADGKEDGAQYNPKKTTYKPYPNFTPHSSGQDTRNPYNKTGGNQRGKEPRTTWNEARKPYSNPMYSRCRIAPTEKDPNLRRFNVVNPEGEVHTVDTSDTSSPFHGPVWTRILSAYESGEYLRGRALFRSISRQDGRFSGYNVSIDGVPAFLPRKEAALFRGEERDATNKCLALKVEKIHTNGDRAGNVFVSAKEPWEKTFKEFNHMSAGKEIYALATDYEHRELLFPGSYDHDENSKVVRWQMVSVPLDKALRIGSRQGIKDENFLTGLYWKLRIVGHDITSREGDKWIAEPLEVLV
jgi:hypothetical protein